MGDELLDYSTHWGLRWIAFWTIFAGLFVFLIVQNGEQYELGHLCDDHGQNCLVVSGNVDNGYRLFMMDSNSNCTKGNHALFAMRHQQRESLIIFQHGHGPLMCITDDPGKPFLVLAPCVQDQPNQIWHIYEYKWLSDIAIDVKAPKKCVGVIPTSIWGESQRLQMEVCRLSSRQLFTFTPLQH